MKIIRGSVKRAQRVLIYGVEGVGKTTLVSKLKNVLILDTEGGADNVDCDHAPVESLDDLREAMATILREKKAGTCPYEVVALDTADRVWAMCAESIVRENKLKSIEEMLYGKGLKMATDLFVRVVTGGMDKLANAGLHVIVCAHCKIERISPPETADYTQYQVKVSAPGKQAEEAAALIKQWADAILFCHFNTCVNSATGKALSEERVIATTHSAQWEAKNRFGLADELPMESAAIASIFPELGEPACPASAPAPAVAAVAAVPAPVAAAPATEAKPVSPTSAAFAQKAPEVVAAPSPLPELLQGHEEALCEFLVSKGQLRRGEGVEQISEGMLERIRRNPQAVLSAISK